MTLRWSAEKWHKSFWCRLFGHRWHDGWWGSKPYLRASRGPVDGINEHHIRLDCECWRCGGRFHIANIHESALRRVLREGAE